jgi:hypothetical protein
MQFVEAQQDLCRDLNINFTDVTAGQNSLFSLDDIKAFVIAGAHQAWDYKPWTFTEKTYTFSITSGIVTAGYVDYPSNFEDESAYRLEIEGVAEFTKKNFADYQKWFTDYPNDTSKIWSEHERFIFTNPNAISAGQTADITGKLRMPTPVNDTDLLPFSPTQDNNENSGNDAIVHLARAHALQSEKKKEYTQAVAVEKDALAMLDNVWKPMGERRAQQQSQNRSFFNTFDFFPNRRSTRGDTNIGNFP